MFADVDAITVGKPVSHTYVDGFIAPAGVIQSEKGGRWVIVIDRQFLSKVKDETMRVLLEKGLRVHEGAHVLYSDMELAREAMKKHERSGNSTFYHTLLNILDDVHVEYLIEKNFPMLSKYLSTVLSVFQEMTVNDQKLDDRNALEKTGIKVDERSGKLMQTLDAMFQAVRLGEVDNSLFTTDVVEDLGFIVPRVFLSRRGTGTQSCIQAADEIYYYLDKKYGVPHEIEVKLTVKVPDSQDCEENEKKEKTGGKESSGQRKKRTQVIPWKSRSAVEKNKESAYKEAGDALDEAKKSCGTGGRLGAYEEPTLTPPKVNDIEFYLASVEKNEETIRRIQAILARIVGKRWFVPATDGDFNTKPEMMQNAYMDSFRGTDCDGKYYLVLKPELPETDLALVIDQSGSTYGSEQLFAESSICLIEAARRVRKIRIAGVGLGDGIRILKSFQEPLEAGRFAPTSGGGTPLGAAIQETAKLSWRGGGVVRIAMILTDGYPDSFEELDKGLERLRERGIGVIATCVGIEPNDDYRSRFDEVYQVNDPKDLALTMFDAFYNAAVHRAHMPHLSSHPELVQAV